MKKTVFDCVIMYTITCVILYVLCNYTHCYFLVFLHVRLKE